MSARCDRFEREALLELERGSELDPHFASCQDCLAAAERYRALDEGLRSLARDEEPPPGWRDAVWEKVALRTASRRWRGWAWAPAGLAAAAAMAVLLLPRPPARPLSLAVEVAPGDGPPRRTATAVAGDRLLLRIPMSGAAHAELRVYHNETDLVLRCSDQPPCRREGDDLVARIALDTMGRYQAVAVVSARGPLPAGHGLDADSAAALESGAGVYFGREVTVE